MIIFRKEYYGSFALFAGLLVGAYIAPHYEIPRISIEWKPPKTYDDSSASPAPFLVATAISSPQMLPSASGKSSAAAPQQSLAGDNSLPPPPSPSSRNLSVANISFSNPAPSIQEPEAETAGSNVSTTLEASPSHLILPALGESSAAAPQQSLTGDNFLPPPPPPSSSNLSAAKISFPNAAPSIQKPEAEAELAGSNVSTTLEASPSPSIPASSELKTRCDPPCVNGTCNEELGRCDLGDCPECGLPNEAALKNSGFTSPDIPFSQWCFGNCSGRGECKHGFCKCQPGFWGTDCGISHSLDGSLLLYEQTAPRGEEVLSPRIYVYELPPDFTVFSRRLGVLDDLAGVAFGFAERMFRSAHRTLDPNAADWFFAPGVGNCKSMNALSEYVRTTWPDLFGLTGARHVWPSIGQDFGFSNGANNKFGPCYVKDNKILPHLADSVFMDFRGPSKACFNLFRPGQDVRLPPLIVIGRTSQQIMPQDAVFSPRMHQFLKSSKATWQKRLSQTAGQIANNPMFLFAGKSAPLCWDKKEDGISKRCFNGGNSRGLLQNLFNTPFYSYPQGQKLLTVSSGTASNLAQWAQKLMRCRMLPCNLL
ncbi:hypothetical protein CYMTET_50852 [Cymbomonas tetramitiformis]|uniref:EGF-like domain-containing protein n=1 Tax=Cymbomonas tetramitiformis TaxID=36881 RepID=A0AAE0BP80_9CHLO|nr:hypothetical protein CYMTET_50852 [Cymbomonas tetramitiformis]